MAINEPISYLSSLKGYIIHNFSRKIHEIHRICRRLRHDG